MSELDILGVLEGADKSSSVDWAWDYLRHYESLFDRWRHEEINIIEIGVGGGASLRTWRRYFDRARLVGIDIDPACRHVVPDRTVVEIGSQDDLSFLRAVATKHPPTIVIDDGSHLAHHMVASFEGLFPCLAPGGLYVFEDLSFHLEEGVGQWLGAKEHRGLSDTSIYDYLSRFVRARVANVSTPGDTSGFTRYAFEQIDEITVFGGALVVRKREPRDLNLAASMFERELARSQPTSIVVERYSAYMIKHGGPLDRPLNLLKSEVTANPGNQSALALLSKVLAQLGRLDEAAEAANALVALAPAQPTWWLQLADVQGSRNRPDLELAALRRLGELQPDLADVHDRLGAIHERLGDLPAALIAARRASDLQPNSGHFRSRVAELERRA